MTVSRSVSPGETLVRLAPPACAISSTTTPPKTPSASPATSPTGPYQGGHCRSPASFTRCSLKLVERRDHANAGRCGECGGVPGASQPDRRDAGGDRPVDVLEQAVADVDGLPGLGPGARERRGEQLAGGLRHANLG